MTDGDDFGRRAVSDEGLRSEPADAHAATAAELVADAEYGRRHIGGFAGVAVAVLAAGWSLFQLALPRFVTLNSDYVRVTHLCFAMGLVYLCFPMFKELRPRGIFSALGADRRLPVFDILLATLAVAAAAYLAIDYEGIAGRQGRPLLRDMIVGVALVVLLLEAARRALGPALTIVACCFIIYALAGPYMPDLLAFRGASFRRLVGQLTLSTAGIYGVPLRVSADTVFLFVLLGAMLERSGGGKYFVDLAFSLLGRYKGGPAKAAVLSSGLTGMVSGSSIANVVTTGTFTIPLMVNSGYPREKAAAIEVAASTNGQLMPPIMGAAAFIIAEYCELTYLAVVRAAFIPAVVSYLALIYITHLEAGKLGLTGMARADLPRFFTTLIGGIHFLVPLASLITMLMRGFSAQMAAFYAICALAALVLVRGVAVTPLPGRTRRAGLWEAIRALGGSLVAGGKGMMAVGVACATAGIIVGIVGTGLGQQISAIVDTLAGGNIVVILLLTALASLILGMGLPTTANYIVMASLIAPVIVTIGAEAGLVVPPIAAHLFCFFFGILADDTPPVGLAAYAAAAIAKSKPIATGVQGFFYDLRTAILPFMFVFNTDLLLWKIEGWWHIGIIFASATLAMFAFAGLTQCYVVTRNRLYESVLLAAATGVLLRPQLPGELLASQGLTLAVATSKFTWYAIGSALFALVWLNQRRRAAKAA